MKGETVLVTGINGYIGSHVGLQLLRKGYNVRGASRSGAAKQTLLKEAFKGYESQYEHFIVPDITTAGAYDEAVKGVHAIIHIASPIDFKLPNVEAFFGPAAGGVSSILNSTQQAGPQLKSFVLTSSIAAVLDRFKNPPDYVYDDSDWNTTSEPMARKQFNAGAAYGASKAIAEKTMWEWRDNNKPSFALSAIQPGFVLGPAVVWPETPDRLNESLAGVWEIFSGQMEAMPPGIGGGTAIDVRDTAALHVWCAEHPTEADGQRYIAVTGKMPPQAWADLMRKHYPDRDILLGTPGEGYVAGTYEFPPGTGDVKADKMFAALGGKEKLVNLDKMILESVEAFEQRYPGVAKNKKQ